MFKYQTYTIGENPKNLVFFLHGYNGTIADHQYAIDWLKEKLKSSYLVIPQAPEQCDKNPDKLQWFGMMKYDLQDKRKDSGTSAEEIFAIYDKSQQEIASRAQEMNAFIAKVQAEHHIDDRHTYLCGFSQGAMLTLYTALTRKKPLAAAFVIAGLVAGKSLLEKQINSPTPITLLHGEDDMRVQYKTMPHTQHWLEQHNIPVTTKTFPQLVHRINEQEIDMVASIVNKNS